MQIPSDKLLLCTKYISTPRARAILHTNFGQNIVQHKFGWFGYDGHASGHASGRVINFD